LIVKGGKKKFLLLKGSSWGLLLKSLPFLDFFIIPNVEKTDIFSVSYNGIRILV
jgi:hypothetical protein